MNKLEYYGGNGFTGLQEYGDYEVKTDSGFMRFKKLSEAKEYYDSINDEKALWDIIGMELIECHYLKP